MLNLRHYCFENYFAFKAIKHLTVESLMAN